MIEVFDSRVNHLARCCQRERLAAQAAQTLEAKRIHQWLADIYAREAMRIDR